MFIRKKTAAILAAILCVSTSVSAQISIDNFEAEFSTDKVSVAGAVGVAESDVLITVYKKGAATENFTEWLGWQNMVISDAEGKYEDEFKMSGAGIYTLIAATKNESEKLDFVYTDSDSASKAIDAINTTSDLASCMAENKVDLALWFPNIDNEPSWTTAAGYAKGYLPMSKANIDATVKLLRQCVLLSYISGGDVENIFDYADVLDIFEIENNAVFSEELFTEAHKKAASERVSGKTINSYSDFCDKIKEAMILTVIENPNGFGNVKKVLQAHSEFIGISTENTPDSVYRNLAGHSYASIAELKAAYDKEKAALKTENGTRPGGGSGGGGGGGIGGGSALNMQYEPIASEDKPTAVSIDTIFTDLEGFDWAKEAIRTLYGKRIVQGKADGVFAPNDNVTRAEFVKMLTGAMETEEREGEINFTDVAVDDWAYPYIKKAYLSGIVKGVNDDTFNGDAYISRQDMAVMICRALEAAGHNVSVSADEKFEDDAAIADYSKEAVYVLKARGILNGDENGKFYPANYANRAEAAKVIHLAAK